MNTVVALRPEPLAVTYSVRQIPIDRIRAFAFQPRKWFDADEIKARAESMKAMGQQDPVTVEPVYGDPDHDFELINGESRLRSARKAGIATLWAAVRSVPYASKFDKHLASLVANFNRSDHTPMEISNAFRVQVVEGGKTQAEIARAIGKPDMWVSHYMSLQKLHPELQALLHPSIPKNRRLAATTGFELARLPMNKQVEILRLCRDANGDVNVLRVRIRALKACGQEVRLVAKENVFAWTPERERRRQALVTPVPEHVAHLRAGIKEFRELLAARGSRF